MNSSQEPTSSSNPAPMQEGEYQKMEALERSHWWYRALHGWIARRLAAHVGSRGAREFRWLDAGCGTGGLLSFVQERAGLRGQGFEFLPAAVERCRAQGFTVAPGDLTRPETWPAGEWDAITVIDAFYFVEGDAAKRSILEAFWQRLAPGGILVLHLPALRAFGGTHDLRVGITERCTREQALGWLGTRLWKVHEARYRLFFLSPLIALSRAWSRIQWRRAQKRGATLPESSDLAPVQPILNFMFGAVTQFEDRLLSFAGLTPPWGSSLALVVEKPVR